jgi:hypothetical protein
VSKIGEIVTFLEQQIELVLPTIKKSPNYYNLKNNSGAHNNYIYAVLPGNANPVSGTIKSATYQQEFSIRITKDFIDRPHSDDKLREVIEQIYEDNEKIMDAVALRRSPTILVIEPPTIDRPEVQETEKSVSVTFSYSIQYRKSIQGVS